MADANALLVQRRAVADQLGTLAAAAHRTFMRALNKALAQEGLTHVQFLALHQIHTLGSMSQSELAEVLAVEGQSLVRLLDVLEREGWVRRVPDARDRRVNRLELAAERQRISKVLEIFRELQVAALDSFSAQELEQFLHLQQKLSAGLGRLDEQG